MRTPSSRSGSASRGGTPYGIPASRILRFARVRRWPSVGSGTRNARAISRVVEPGDRAQRERDPSVEGERGVAAGEEQPQPVIRDLVHVVSHRLELGDLQRGGGLLPAHPFPPEPVDRAVAGRGEQPRGGVARHAALRPRAQRLLAGLLPGLFRQVEVVGHPDQGGHGAPRVVPVGAVDDLGDGRHPSTSGRTSIVPACTLGISCGDVDRGVEVRHVDRGSSRRAVPWSPRTVRR